MATVSNVAAGKPAIGGAISIAPLGTTLPTDASTALSGSFTNLGYVSAEGLTKTQARETAEIKAWGGDVVMMPQSGFKETVKFKLIEYLNVAVKKVALGDANVSGAIDTGITALVNSKELEEHVYVIDTIVHGALERTVIPCGKVTEVGDIVYVDNDVIGYPITITALPDTYGQASYEYTIKVTGATGATE